MSYTKTKTTAIILIAAFFIGFWIYSTHTDKSLPIIAITQIATHPALDEVRSGLISGLEEKGYKDGRNIHIVFRNANGDSSLTLPIAQEFVRENAAVIVPISTPSALAVAKSTNTIPIVFSGVSDPISVGLLDNFEKPGGNITGVVDQWPYEAQINTFFKYFPNTKRIGMLYTRGDDVSKIGVDAISKIAKLNGFELELAAVSSPQDVYPSAVSLFRNVDAVFTGIDHLILENMDGLIKASIEANKPIFGGESGSVKKGAVLAVSINMSEFGKVTSDIVVSVLKGKKPGLIPVRIMATGDVIINRHAAERFNLNLTELEQSGAKIIN